MQITKEQQAVVDSIPSMGGREIATHLRHYAARTPAGSAIVEVGSWLGAGTVQLAIGASNNAHRPPIFVHDRFRAAKTEVLKAESGGVTLRRRQNTLPFVKGKLAQFGVDIHFRRTLIKDIIWKDGPIGLYVDDAAKGPPDFAHVLRTFGPSWIAGETVLILMDYHYWQKAKDRAAAERYRCQFDFINAHPENFEVIDDNKVGGTSAAIIRYVTPFDFTTVPEPEWETKGVLASLVRRLGAKKAGI